MSAKKPQLWFAVIVPLLISTYGLIIIALPGKVISNDASDARNKDAVNLSERSKAEIVNELKTIEKRIERIEEINGRSGAAGFKVYSPEETAILLNYYKKLRTGLEYLNKGLINDINDWEGYSLAAKERTSYNSEEALQILREQEEAGLPSVFLAGFRVYLLPVGLPEISGLGGAGFALISAPENKDKSFEQLRVTLLHELGHHIHSRFMPFPAGLPSPLWEKYLEIRGGEWRKAGDVNTAAWRDSSEETFAEDFRLLFGKNQYYYGDISLGDPRDNPETATRLRQFILGLKSQQSLEEVKSPWVPDALNFWLNSQYYIFPGWAVMIGGIIALFYMARSDGNRTGSLYNIMRDYSKVSLRPTRQNAEI